MIYILSSIFEHFLAQLHITSRLYMTFLQALERSAFQGLQKCGGEKPRKGA
jgi:hypothetical protein